MTDCHLHITAGTGACKHIKFVLHRTSNDAYLGEFITTRAALEEEIAEYDKAGEKVKAQIEGIVLGNLGKTPAQLKTILEAAVIRI
jgi:hypothetical protein